MLKPQVKDSLTVKDTNHRRTKGNMDNRPVFLDVIRQAEEVEEDEDNVPISTINIQQKVHSKQKERGEYSPRS